MFFKKIKEKLRKEGEGRYGQEKYGNAADRSIADRFPDADKFGVYFVGGNSGWE